MQKEPKTRLKSLNPLSFGLSARLCESGFRNQCSLCKVPLRQSIYLHERNLFARRRSFHYQCLSNIFSKHGKVMIRHSKGENTTSLLFHSPLIIPCVPVTFAKLKCGRGSAKDFISLQDSRTRSYEENIFQKCIKD